MSTSGKLPEGQLFEFGPFRVDPGKEILLRAGEPVPLTPKTFQILMVLIRHGRDVVTKDDLMKSVWPDTFVEEANLSRNIFMLRKALGETPQDHRYIVTVPGRGYRLAENVRLVPGRELSIVAASHSKMQVQLAATKPWRWLAVAALALLAAVALALWFSRTTRPLLTEKDTVVLADFANSTGDPVFDGTLRQGLEIQLEQSPFFSLVSQDRVQRTLRLMGQPAEATLTPRLAREICARTGSAAVLAGSISPLGSQFVLGLRATNCQTGEVLGQEQAQVARKEDVLNALGQIARKLRARLGESLASIQRHDTPLVEATTPSLDALNAYSEAWRLNFASGGVAAIPFARRAVQIDPQFALAYAFLGRLYGDIGESALSADSVTRAYRLRQHASDREKFFITAMYERQATENLEKARETCLLWAQAYPRDTGPPGLLSGGILQAFGDYQKGVEEAQKAIALDPDFPFGYSNLARDDISLGRLNQAKSVLQQASQHKLETPDLFADRFAIAFLQADSAGMDRVAARSEGKLGVEDRITENQAYALAYIGRLQQARNFTRRAEQMAEQAGRPETAAQYEAAEAVREALYGNPPEARRSALAALALSQGRDVEYGAAIALVLSGDSSLAQGLANDLNHRFPEGTLVKFSYIPTLRALLALNRRAPRKALELLQIASPDELGYLGADSAGFAGSLYPAYARGLADLDAHQAAQAAAEFQKIIDHPGIVVSDPIGALARLQIGRAYALEARSSHGADAVAARANARAAYRDFLTLWKNADPGIPILLQAKAEYASLP